MIRLFSLYYEFGWKIMLIRIFHKMCSFIGLYWESSFLLVQNICIKDVNSALSVRKDLIEKYTPKELSYDDFLLGNVREFNDTKLKIISNRFGRVDVYRPFGVVYDDKLIYSCWIYDKNELILSYNTRLPMEYQALLMDDFCDPQYRGNGIHTMMNFYRLKVLYSSGKSKVAVLVHSYNKPALKSQINAGFAIKEQIIVIKFCGKKKIIRKNIIK